MLTAMMRFLKGGIACDMLRCMSPYCDLPSFWYSSIVFFSPTLKPSVCSGTRSSWTAASLDMMMAIRPKSWNGLGASVKREGQASVGIVILLDSEFRYGGRSVRRGFVSLRRRQEWEEVGSASDFSGSKPSRFGAA